mmetsp:Transcript_30808/g.35074  ORF Transcript_30808/g.35074 Transcript_30808/m.35074 type:complete len:95 (-) Transcript_30808:217-501(-)
MDCLCILIIGKDLHGKNCNYDREDHFDHSQDKRSRVFEVEDQQKIQDHHDRKKKPEQLEETDILDSATNAHKVTTTRCILASHCVNGMLVWSEE